MANSVAIPQDIIDNIIAAVGNDEHLLKQCALVSSSFLRPSRKQLFSEISLASDQSSQRLHRFLVQNPVIQSFVRSITITGIQYWRPETSENNTSLLAVLRLPFCCLESFSIVFWHPLDWSSFSGELKEVLSNVIHSPTLKTLYLESVVNVPITLFLGIVHLTKLELDYLSPNDFDDEKSSLPTLAASKGVATTASHPAIDHCVWTFRERVHGPNEPIFLPFMCRLYSFEINVDLGSATMSDFDILSFLMHSLCVSLTSPATLEHLKLNIWFRGYDNNFDHYGFYEDLRDNDVWSHLDSIITHPTGSRLQRVDIDIDYIFRYDDNVAEPDNDRILEAVLDGLPLLREKGILFVEATAGV